MDANRGKLTMGQRWSGARPTKAATFWCCVASAVLTMIRAVTAGTPARIWRTTSRLDRGHNISRRAAPRVAPGIVPARLAVPKWAPPGCP
jgi:hypothetical protein